MSRVNRAPVAPRFIDALLVDLQGRTRVKRLPASQRDKLLAGETRMPLSTLCQDIFGEDLPELTGSGLVDGDPDGVCIAAADTLGVQPWYIAAEQVMISLHDGSGDPAPLDPRGILQRQIAALARLGLHATVAVELEFYLFDGSTRDSGVPAVPGRLAIAGAPNALQLYDARVMDRIEPVLDTIHRWSAALGIPAEASIAEFGPGQFEINLRHRADPLRAADEAQLFRRTVDRAAFDAGLLASFMAKPYTEHGGSGQHVHLSLSDSGGRNVFDAGQAPARETLGQARLAAPLAHAVAGLLDTMEEAQLLFAPHGNSYRRLLPDSYAPHRIDWGLDHRAAAIRLPVTDGRDARLEHRVAGADANSYLVLAALLAGVRHGIERGRLPVAPPLQVGQASTAPLLTHDWFLACERFHASSTVRELLGERVVEVFGAVKRHEALDVLRRVGSVDWQVWLSRV